MCSHAGEQCQHTAPMSRVHGVLLLLPASCCSPLRVKSFHKMQYNNMSVCCETQCLSGLTMLGGRNLFRKKEKKGKKHTQKKAPTIQRRWLFSLAFFFFFFSLNPHSRGGFYSPQQFTPLTAKALEEVPPTTRQFVLTLDADAGRIFWSLWVRSIDLGRVSSQKPLLAALSSGDVMRRERERRGRVPSAPTPRVNRLWAHTGYFLPHTHTHWILCDLMHVVIYDL